MKKANSTATQIKAKLGLHGVSDPDAAKAFLHDWLDIWQEAMTQSTGYNMPMFENLFTKPMPVIGQDPKYQILQDFKGDHEHHRAHDHDQIPGVRTQIFQQAKLFHLH